MKIQINFKQYIKLCELRKALFSIFILYLKLFILTVTWSPSVKYLQLKFKVCPSNYLGLELQ